MDRRIWVYTPNRTKLRFVYNSDRRILDVFERESGMPTMSIFFGLRGALESDKDFHNYCDEIAAGRIPHRD